MAIDCDHPRPPLNLPRKTPAQLAWQVPSYLSEDPLEMRRQLLEVLSGIYLEEQTRFATPAIIPLHGEDFTVGPGSVVKGVASGQTVTLLPSVPGGSTEPVVFILTAVSDPLVVALPPATGETDGTQTEIGVAGVYTFFPDDISGFQQPPGDSSPIGTGVTGPVLLGRNEATAGTVVPLTTTDTTEIDAVTTSPTAISWVLNVASVALAKLADLTGLSVLGRAANSSGVMAAITATAARQVLRNNDAGTALEWGNPVEVRDSGADQGDAFALNFVAGTNVNIAATVAAGVATITPSVDLTSVTYTAGDGLDLVGNEFAVDVSDFAGTGLEDGGANDLRIAASAAGAGLTGGGGSALAVGAGAGITVNANDVQLDTMADDQFLANISGGVAAPVGVALSTLAGAGLTGGANAVLNVGAGDGIDVAADSVAVDVSDFAGAGIEDDGANNLRIATSAAGGGLGGGGGSALFVQSSLDSNARVGVRESTGTTFLRRRISFIEGANVSLTVNDDAGNEEVDVTISATDTDTTYSAGSGLNLAGTTFSVDPNDLDSTSVVVSGGTFQRAAISGDITISQNSNSAAISAGVIVNNDINASAAIATSKLADGSDFARLSATQVFTGANAFESDFRLRGVFTTSATGTINNLAIGNVNVVRFTGASKTLTGMVATSSGQFVLLVNAGTNDLIISTGNGSSSAANQIGGASEDMTIEPGDTTLAWYDVTSSLWRPVRAVL